MDLNRLEHILDRAASKRITVIGDLMLDEFVWGKVGRISPEAPVPVVEVIEESFYPGGAANVARNLREFVDHVAIIGLLGKDRSGQQLQELLREQRIDISNVVEDESFRTILKTRIIALHQQVVRVDREQLPGRRYRKFSESWQPSDKIFQRQTRSSSKTTAKVFCRPRCFHKSRAMRARPARSSRLIPIPGISWIGEGRQ